MEYSELVSLGSPSQGASSLRSLRLFRVEYSELVSLGSPSQGASSLRSSRLSLTLSLTRSSQGAVQGRGGMEASGRSQLRDQAQAAHRRLQAKVRGAGRRNVGVCSRLLCLGRSGGCEGVVPGGEVSSGQALQRRRRRRRTRFVKFKFNKSQTTPSGIFKWPAAGIPGAKSPGGETGAESPGGFF